MLFDMIDTDNNDIVTCGEFTKWILYPYENRSPDSKVKAAPDLLIKEICSHVRAAVYQYVERQEKEGQLFANQADLLSGDQEIP
eukprot:UN08088